jgi:redox-sensitive bicupin YhaK (pirin superfamily)
MARNQSTKRQHNSPHKTKASIAIIILQLFSQPPLITALSQSQSMSKLRPLKQILPQTPRHWVGDGFHVHPVFASKAFTEELSPFLMFDYAPPTHFEPGHPRGVGRHPHRGFETVTVAFQGEVEHKDSVGNRDVIKAGDVQWMTAGRGIIHQEHFSEEFAQRGGTLEMCQLWVNLPAKDKMVKPGYQPIVEKDIPSVELFASSEDGECANNSESVGKVRVIAGTFQGTKGPASTFSPVELWDVILSKSNNVVDLPFPKDYNCIVFVRRGKASILDDDGINEVGPQSVALMERKGSTLRVKADEDDTSLLIMGGMPLNEPIAARGPFVMNTWEELAQANRDYQLGNFGS